MAKAIRVLLIIFSTSALYSTSALADVDKHFGKGVLGCNWGSTLQQVQSKHPGGFTWPNQGDGIKGEVVYAISGKFSLPSVEVASPLVHFVFSKDNELQRVFLHFKPADRDSVLYQIAQLLGQDYSVLDQPMSREFEWKRGRASFARYELGNLPDYSWAYLGVRSMIDKKSDRQ